MRFFNPNRETKGLKLAASIQNLRARLLSASTSSLQTQLPSPSPSPTNSSILRDPVERYSVDDIMNTGPQLQSMLDDNISKTIQRKLALAENDTDVLATASDEPEPPRTDGFESGVNKEVGVPTFGTGVRELNCANVEEMAGDKGDPKNFDHDVDAEIEEDAIFQVETSTGLRRYTDATEDSYEAPPLIGTSGSLVVDSGSTLVEDSGRFSPLSEIIEESDSEKDAANELFSNSERNMGRPCVYCEYKEEHRFRHKALPTPTPTPEQEARMNIADYDLLLQESREKFSTIGGKPYGSPDCVPFEYYENLENNLASLQHLYELLEFDQYRKTRHLNFTKRAHRFLNHPWEILYTEARNERMRELAQSNAWVTLPALAKAEKADEILALMGTIPLPEDKPMVIPAKKCAKPEPDRCTLGVSDR